MLGLPSMSGAALSRRQAALGLLAAAMSGSLVACSEPEEEILPYVNQPEGLIPGVPQRYATALPLNGYGRGVVCTAFEGRPVKIEGNALHPASLGATDAFAEAELMQLYDPDRLRSPRRDGRPASWEVFLAELLPRLDPARGGEGLRLLTGPLTSPTLLRLIGALRERFPRMGWHTHAPIDEENARRGAELAFGRPLDLLPVLDRAEVVLCLDADPLGPGPDQIRHGRGFAAQRQARAGAARFGRLYALEPAISLTGANADHHLLARPEEFRDLAAWLAAELGAPLPRPELPEDRRRILRAVAADLAAHAGAALVLAGEALAPELHALAHWLNARLAAPVEAVAPVQGAAAPLRELVAAMRAGQVETLLILGANPAYDAPADLGFAEALRQVPFAACHGLHLDETAAACRWALPAPHALEEWGDLRARDGSAAIVQPLIRPLYGTRSAPALLGLLLGQLDLSAHEAVRATWRGDRTPEEFEAWWRRAVHDGLVPESAAPRLALPVPRLPELPPAPRQEGMVLLLRPDASTWDGSFANNAWLQECPQPLTRQVWGHAARLAPEEAARHGLTAGQVVRLEIDGRSLEVTTLLDPGVAPGVVALTLGHGRSRAGALGTGLGADAYRLRRSDALWVLPGLRLAPTGRHEPPILAQQEQQLEGEARDLLPLVTLDAALRDHEPSPQHRIDQPSLYPDFRYDAQAWAMVIDTTLCIGCNACVIACQAENNIPVIGPEEVARGRDMHWLRIDTYVQEAGGTLRPGFQPVPCMHCEQAPCEPVCPVAASVHDHEGLNVQVYNRCIGTRFCQSNCPYKVRRFNFYGYADGQEYGNRGAPVVAAQHNPEVTVRARGVMEKCTYCVQRISAARRQAEKEDRPIGPEEVVTACQAACPTRAIRFGDLSRPESDPARLRREPHHYALLGELGTRPRTTYLQRVRNPNPALEGGGA
ncbi:4Fe-4S dicluster domain-containing protein [Siccirubricoccus sp. KC 17139]|uniref:4Fe-4S dicluster domain-containing protein n=1 Tax=Siccirubricoccus soli TaxID=2899147 RepID=A0ABT1D7Q0_9PROT|nr:4Fe-4S dicluster domain-containing protein [Siccirubricoccus soli]MCO6417965.1 4Fe-4S dicluster domain-containing protein [Siccirubricoccus soli]MCP2684100.1 4Fe-4S dicluster domain-containing protein [Siccirubricoccus soli]